MTIAAFVLSVIALLTSLWLTWLRWPRIAVEVSKRVGGTIDASMQPPTMAARGEVEVRKEPSADPEAMQQRGFRGTAEREGDPKRIPSGGASGTYGWKGKAEGYAPGIVLTVINKGSEAITIKTIGFTPADQKRSRSRLDFLETWRNRGAALPTTFDRVEAVLPVRIEGHDCRIFEYNENAVSKALLAGEYRGYAQRYKSFRIRRNRPMVRESTSEDTIHIDSP